MINYQVTLTITTAGHSSLNDNSGLLIFIFSQPLFRAYFACLHQMRDKTHTFIIFNIMRLMLIGSFIIDKRIHILNECIKHSLVTINEICLFPEPKVMSSYYFFVKPAVQNPKTFTMISKRKKQQILTVKKLERVNVIYFYFFKYIFMINDLYCMIN